MTFDNEEEFRKWIVKELPKHLDEEWAVLQGKNVSDILLCWNNSSRPLLLFVEVKYHKLKHGRIGFGSGDGGGFQTEILLKRPLYLERFMQWIVADQDSGSCLSFDNDGVRNNCAGEIKVGKQNNFTSGLFRKNKSDCFNLTEAPCRIAEWAFQVVSNYRNVDGK